MGLTNNTVTADQVSELYQKLPDKMLFIAVFGKTRFHLCGEEMLTKMYDFLIKKVK